ncbi:Proton extrusion protein PcxA [Hyella patelloides LEGE 07179]|uniref:Proton extrusion protein PxcA n=1 Tax=Hyella patelloides LEGE 07179 TaxID=945734 RepID=A0A563VTZ2_9CYAN|nr:proton extrusion protein PcxA [Hyella patelloides]VEP14942.1 Proton extrusion protein PcxA [Hyella patelloides LEGE 07179]
MPSFFPQRKSSLSQIKNQFFGNPEQSLKEAYEAASKIKTIENHYFSGYKIPIESLQNERLQAEVRENLEILQSRIEEFNASSSASGKLGSNHLEKLIFVEGILANYSLEANQASGLMAMPPQPEINSTNSALSNTNIVDVPSSIEPSAKSKERKPKANSRGRQQGNKVNPADALLGSGGMFSPGSVGKAFNKIKSDLNPDSEQEVVNEFRRSRAVTMVGVRLLALLIVAPILTQQVSKYFVIAPIVEQYRGGAEAVVSLDELNSEWREEALLELNSYEEELKMEHMFKGVPPIAPEVREEKVQEKANEIAEVYHQKNTNAISNVFADFVGLIVFAMVLLLRRRDINVLKTFIDNIIYGLSDSAKAFAIILFTDMFVGFHSPHGWEVLLESMANHLGVAANHSGISLFIATVPVVMDTMMKYWIFRYLSQMSASTVATLKEMNE